MSNSSGLSGVGFFFPESQFWQEKLDFRWDLEETLPLSSVCPAGPRECCLCGDVATLECSECFKDKVFAATGLKQFCSSCSRQIFSMDVPKIHLGSCQQDEPSQNPHISLSVPAAA